MSQLPDEKNVDSYTRITSKTESCFGNVETKTVVEEWLTGEPAKIYAEAQARIAEQGENKKNILWYILEEHGWKIFFAVIIYRMFRGQTSNTPSTSTPGKAVAADTKVPVDHNVPGNGGGTA